MIKFNKHNVTNGKTKVRCWYALDNRVDGRQCVTIYAKDYCNAMAHLFPECYVNNSDSMTDYFEKGRVVLFPDHPWYAHARSRAMINVADQRIKEEQRRMEREAAIA